MVVCAVICEPVSDFKNREKYRETRLNSALKLHNSHRSALNKVFLFKSPK